MELNDTALREARDAFLARYPGFEDFANAAYLADERDYKNELVELFRQRVRPALTVPDDAALGEAALGLLVEPLKTTSKPQNIVDWRSFPPPNKLGEEHKREFGRMIRTLFDTESPLDERLRATNASLEALYQHLEMKFTPGMSRVLLSFYLALDDPRKYWFIKTNRVKRAMQALAPGIKLPSAPLAANDVSQLRQFAEAVYAKLQDWGWKPRDLLDVEGFIWVAYAAVEEGAFEQHTSSINSEHVRLALKEIDDSGIPSDAQSTTYDLINGVTRYPPKLVLSLAAKHVTGKEFDRSLFSGGEASQAFALLRKLGYQIERKDFVSNLVRKFIDQANAASDLSTAHYPKQYRGLKVSVSFGQGNFAKVPWISFTGYEQTTQQGIYPVFLYYKSISVLVLAFGVSETRSPQIKWPKILRQQTVADYLGEHFSHKPERYGDSFVAAAYQVPAELNLNQINQDLDKAIAEFEAVVSKNIGEAPSPLTEDRSMLKNAKSYPLNLIYYGPPGTGKTYSTFATAVEICDGEIPEDRATLVARFKELQEKRRISFVTFHQSYSYEDFVEGIRPTLAGETETEGAAGANGIGYECRPGVFRTICGLAKEPTKDKSTAYDFDPDQVSFWKMSLGDTSLESEAHIYDQCIEKGQLLLGWGQGLNYTGCDDKTAVINKLKEVKPDIAINDYNVTSIHYFKNYIKVGDVVIVSDGNLKFRAIGKVTGEYQYLKEDEYAQMRPVEWLIVYDESQPYEKILRKKFSQMTLYHLSKKVLRVDALQELLTGQAPSEPQNYVLIIDEINRGNIAKIFGELISLVEEDKRLGAANELTAVLPYSGNPFGVPQNLYIVGTMNTADRSIALLDTALRRRFEFEELMPQDELIPGNSGQGIIPDGEEGEIDLRALLRAINKRLRFLLNRDQTIGHAYFINVRTFAEVRRVISQQLIPLLQEYFYEDWHRIQLVLRDLKTDGAKNEPQLIRHEKINELDVLGYDHDDYEDGVDYQVVPELEITPAAIRKIYET